MFQEKLQKKLAIFEVGEKKPVQVSDKSFYLTEKGEGEAKLKINLSSPCILVRDLEKRKLQYFKNKKCADYVIFESNNESWRVHIFELKRTVDEKEWSDKIKLQFAGALQNVLALAGVLGISLELDNLVLYTAYRNDKINNPANPVSIRCQMYDKEKAVGKGDCQDWNEERVSIELVESIIAEHHKIPLDIESGVGEYQLK